MPLGSMLTKVDAGRNGDTGFLQQAQRETIAVLAEAAAIGVEIERAIRGHRNRKTQLTQRRQQEIAAGLKFTPPLLENRLCFGGERRQRCILRRGRGSQEQILRQFFSSCI